VLYILGHADGALDFDALIASIRDLYPGTEVTQPDYYTARIAHETEIAREVGMPVPNVVIECTSRVSKEHGLQREFSVPIRDGASMIGRADRLGCVLSGEGISQRDVMVLDSLFRRAGMIVELVGVPLSA
jgi:hypothetical protein